jgi:hypothetical protein
MKTEMNFRSVIKAGEFLDYMSEYQHFKKDHSPSSEDSSVCIATDYGFDSSSSIPGRGKVFFSP